MKYLFHLVLMSGAVLAARAQSTAFTYQGRLAASGSPFSGFAEMQFALFGAPTGGTAIAANTPAIAGVNVSGGLFAVSLDFGVAPFLGEDRWLEIQVRTNVGPFATLTPRQPLTPTPYALYAPTAGTALGPWVSRGGNLATAAKVGIGTTLPTEALDVRGDIRLGDRGEYPALAAEEDLRIIRGTVRRSPSPPIITLGFGFTVTREGEGDYLITFDPPFASEPSVTATVDDFEESLTDVDFYVAGIFAATRSSVRIRTRVHSASAGLPTGPRDALFHFIAAGPR